MGEVDPREVASINWMDLYCGLANARYALELWEREYSVANDRGSEIPPRLVDWCLERGRRERQTLQSLEVVIRPLAVRNALNQVPHE